MRAGTPRVSCVPKSLWVAELIISERTRAKITSYHNIDPNDVRQAIVAAEGLKYKHRSDEPRGPRYYVEFSIGPARVLAALYPVAHPLGDVYALGSAYREPRGLDAVEDEPADAVQAHTAGPDAGAAEDEFSAKGVSSASPSVNEIDEQLP